MMPERAISFMRAFKAEYNHKDVDEACDLAIKLIKKYKKSFRYRLSNYLNKRVG